MDQAFLEAVEKGYALDEPAIVLGAPMHGGEVDPTPRVAVAISMLNRHGLIAGATGTGKTKTIQGMAGQLSRAGVPVFIADVKGDLTGLAAPGDASDPRLTERSAAIGIPFVPSGHPVELLSLSGELGVPVRATVTSFGPLLLSKVLDLNRTQASVLALVFRYCDDAGLPLLDLADLRSVVRYLSSAEGKPAVEAYGGMPRASLGVILRAIVTLEEEGAGRFFGEPEFDIDDLMRTTPDGQGIVSLLELSDVMDQPRLFSTFMLWLLGELYEGLPEAGDLPRPRLVFFFDEAHLLFEDASDALLDEIERTARLIRSKGVGVWFVTHAPTDVPTAILGQLGGRVQHALRAFTPNDADALRKTARTFPMTDFYDVVGTLTSLGTGEAFVTVLSPAGVPTPPVATRMAPPDSLMAPIAAEAAAAVRASSPLAARYGQPVDRESAHEIVSGRLAAASSAAAAALAEAERQKELERSRSAAERAAKEQERETARLARERQRVAERAAREQERAAERASKEQERLIRDAARVLLPPGPGREVVRGILGTLLGGGRVR